MTTPLISMIRPVFVRSDPFSDIVLLSEGPPGAPAPAGGRRVYRSPTDLQAGSDLRRWLSWPTREHSNDATTWSIVGVVRGCAAFAAVVAVQRVRRARRRATKAEYQATVVNARDRVDFALARDREGRLREELANRIDEASVAIGADRGRAGRRRCRTGLRRPERASSSGNARQVLRRARGNRRSVRGPVLRRTRPRLDQRASASPSGTT